MWDEHLVKCHSVHLVCIHCRMYGLVVMLCFTTGTTSRNIDKVYQLDYRCRVYRLISIEPLGLVKNIELYRSALSSDKLLGTGK
jgi:hypothetical protein